VTPTAAHFHAVVWIDHVKARVAFFSATEASHVTLHAHGDPHVHHHAGPTAGSGHAAADRRFLDAVAAALAPAGEILVVGPGGAKAELRKHLAAHAPATAKKVVAVEPMDHPSDRELVAHARRFFKVADHMTPQRPRR
jgi:hypothetical protein